MNTDSTATLSARPGLLVWLDRTPAAFCLLLLALSLWPVWRWSLARLSDGSDDPLGLAALAVLLAALCWKRRQWSRELQPGWALLAALLAVAASLGTGPMLLRAVLAVLSLSALLTGFARRGQALLPFWGLALLALPLLSSLQFYAGFPLRVLTAEASLWLLKLFGFVVERSGTALMVNGQLVLVDAPCSGIHMAWIAYFTACVAALCSGLPDHQLLARLPLVGLSVIAGNILRNTVLVTREAAHWPWPDWAHAAVGLVSMALVCSLIVWLMSRAAPFSAPTEHRTPTARERGRGLLIACILLCGLLPFMQKNNSASSTATSTAPWPARWEGRALQALPLSPVEQRFAAQFPGAIGRFSDGKHLLVLRQIASPTRMLHPAADCYRGLGYAVSNEHLERDAREQLWRVFTATRAGQALHVRERISDAAGNSYTDASSWYWAATLGRTQGPWLAVTVAERS